MLEVVALTDTHWTSALALYLSCGFDEVDQDDADTRLALAL
jgi:hypothetical protein